MKIEELLPNVTVNGALFPEPVQVITVIPLSDAVKLVGKGLNTGLVYEPVLTKEQLACLHSYLPNSI